MANRIKSCRPSVIDHRSGQFGEWASKPRVLGDGHERKIIVKNFGKPNKEGYGRFYWRRTTACFSRILVKKGKPQRSVT